MIAMAAPPVMQFLRNWGAPILGALLALGLGIGFWFYIGEINEARRDAEARVATLESAVKGYQETEKDNAVTIAKLTVRLDAEREMSQTRLDNEQDRRAAAEARNSRFAGALDGLRKEFDLRDCGIGPDLSVGLRDSRDSRESERRSREAASRAAGDRDVPGS